MIFADADLERAAAASPGAMFADADQDCCLRAILVEQPTMDRFMDASRRPSTH